jgi:transcriptional regulator with XRE-family HTH domain
MPSIQSNVLVWARETAGLTVEEAVAKIGLQGAGAVEQLTALETGRKAPTRTQLLKMAKAYRRSLLTFYLQQPPSKGDRGQDFRSVPQRQTTDEPLVDALVRDIRVRQDLVRSAMEEDQDTAPLPFVGSVTMASGVPAVAKSIQSALDFDISKFRAQSTVDAAFSYLRTRTDAW